MSLIMAFIGARKSVRISYRELSIEYDEFRGVRN